MAEVNESNRKAIGPDFITNGQTEENLKPTQQQADTDIIFPKAAEEKSESELEIVAKTSPTAPEAEKKIEVTEPSIEIDLKPVEVLEKKSELASEQVAEIKSLNGQAVENIPEADLEKVILLKLASEKSSELLEGLEEATGCSPSTLLLGNIYRVSNWEGESQLVLKQGKSQQKISTTVEGDIIIKAISRLRKFPEYQELLKLPS